MNTEKQNKIAIPNLDYKAMQTEVTGILNNAKNVNLRSAMAAYITSKQSKLPENTTVDNAVDSILKVSNDFASALPNDIKQDDIENMLRLNIRKLTSKQAVGYLATLETMFQTLDEAAVNGNIPDYETLKNKIQTKVNVADNESIDAIRDQISNLAKSIQSDSLKASVYAAGNNEISEFIKTRDTEMSSETAEQIHNILLDETRKHELYAATACVCYGMALDGKIEGMSANQFDAGILTALVAAGLEKASVLQQYASGKIDEKQAANRLEKIATVLKYILIGVVYVLFFLAVAYAGGTICALLSPWIAFPFFHHGAFNFGILCGIYFTGHLYKHIDSAIERIWGFLKNLTNKAKQIFSSNTNKASNHNSPLSKTSINNAKENALNKNKVKQSVAY